MDTVELRARVEGFLEQVRFQEGTLVREGQLLFVTERRPYEAVLQSAKAQLARAQADLTRAQEHVEVLRARAQLAQQRAALAKARQDVARLRPLIHDRAVPQQDLDTALASEQVAAAEVQATEAALKNTELQERIGILQAQAAVEAPQAAVTQEELNRSYTLVQAPMDGLIGFLAVSGGNVVGPNQNPMLATMSTIDPIEVTSGVSEVQHLNFIRRAGAVTRDKLAEIPLELILADDSVPPYQGKAVAIERALDPQTGTITVQAIFPNPDQLIRPGQFGRVRAAA
jgi:membrane fusion protein (multidrug efflux system)